VHSHLCDPGNEPFPNSLVYNIIRNSTHAPAFEFWLLPILFFVCHLFFSLFTAHFSWLKMMSSASLGFQYMAGKSFSPTLGVKSLIHAILRIGMSLAPIPPACGGIDYRNYLPPASCPQGLTPLVPSIHAGD